MLNSWAKAASITRTVSTPVLSFSGLDTFAISSPTIRDHWCKNDTESAFCLIFLLLTSFSSNCPAVAEVVFSDFSLVVEFKAFLEVKLDFLLFEEDICD